MRVSCPQCRKILNAPDSMAGRRVKCPGCGGPLTLPASAEDATQSAPPASAAPPAGGEPSQPPATAPGGTQSDKFKKRMFWLGLILLAQGGLWILGPLVGAMILNARSGSAPELRGVDVLVILIMGGTSVTLGLFALYAKPWAGWAAVALSVCSLGRALIGLYELPDNMPHAIAVLAVAAIGALAICGGIIALAFSCIRLQKLRPGTVDIASMAAVAALFISAVLIGAAAGPAASKDPPPEKAVQSFNLASVWEANGQWDEAIAGYGKALELAPNYAWPRARLAWIYATAPEERHRNDKKALKLAKELVRQGKKDPRAFDTLVLAVAQARNGQFDAAAGTAERAISLLPGNCAPKDRQWFETVSQCLKSGKAYTQAPPVKRPVPSWATCPYCRGSSANVEFADPPEGDPSAFRCRRCGTIFHSRE